MDRCSWCNVVTVAAVLTLRLDGDTCCKVVQGDAGTCLWSASAGIDGRITVRWIFSKWDVGLWTGLSRLRIGTGDEHL